MKNFILSKKSRRYKYYDFNWFKFAILIISFLIPFIFIIYIVIEEFENIFQIIE